MRTLQQQINYERLEQLPPQYLARIRVGLRSLWQTCSDFWLASPQEPQVRQIINRAGNVEWQVYAPLIGSKLRFDDEQKVMIWLDEQGYRQPRLNPWAEA